MMDWIGTLSAFGLLWATWLGASRVRRLDRLHRRLDATCAGLEAALTARAAAAAAVGISHQAPAGLGAEREAAENALGRALGAVERGGLPEIVAVELADAERQVELARRLHNDAVRDTLGLRSRRMVRWLHLAGHAPMPAYFEIADAHVAGSIRAG